MITNTLQETATLVLAASSYIDVFGSAPAGTTPSEFVRHRLRKLQTELHPDRFRDEDAKRLATNAFARLGTLHDEAQEALRHNKYGERPRLMTVRTPHGEHAVIKATGNGDLSTGYLTESSIAGHRSTFMKVVTDHRNNDLMKTEAKALRRLQGPDSEQKWRPYVTELVDSFVYAERGKPRRQANVLTRIEEFYTLETLKQRFPHGIPVLDMVWMWRRMLMALGFAHQTGVIHGAVLPQNVMILPKEHGLVLGDWCYASVEEDESFPALRAIVGAYRSWYPQEVLSKQAPSPATDLYLAAKTFIWVLGGNPDNGTMPDSVPYPIRAFFRGCLQSSQVSRPQNAWLLLQEFDELLESIGRPFYPRKFHHFAVPAGTANH